MGTKTIDPAVAERTAMLRSDAALKRDRIAAAIRANPDMSPTELGRRFGVPSITVTRIAKALGLPLAHGIKRGAL